LHKAFPLYIAAAEHYSLLLSAKDVPEYERANAKKRWRLVLERAEKVKKRIEDLGGHVGKVGAEDEVEEAAVVARGGNMNGVKLEIWRDPSPGALRAVGEAVEVQPELAKEQEALDPEWAPLPASAWDTNLGQGKWVVRQGPGADCSVVAGLGACLEHNSRWNTSVSYLSCDSSALPGSSDSWPKMRSGPDLRSLSGQARRRTGSMSSNCS